MAKLLRTRLVTKTKKVKKCTKKAPKKASKASVAEHAPKYEFLPELTNAFCGLKFGRFLRGGAAEAKKEMKKLFSNRSTTKIGVAEERNDRGRRVLKNVLLKAYGTEERALLDSAAAPNFLSKDLVNRLGVEPERTSRRISGVTGRKSLVLGLLRNVPLKFAEKMVNLDCFGR